MNIRIRPATLQGTVRAVSSKSHIHRLLIGAALADGPTEIDVNIWSQDMEATARCLTALGAKMAWISRHRFRVEPLAGPLAPAIKLDCGESGSTLRFMLPISAALNNGQIEFTGSGKLPRRPLAALREQMMEHSVKFDSEVLPFTVKDRLCGGFFTMPGNISSQFITGLLLAAPLLAEDTRIFLTTPLESRSYVEMTIDALSHFNIEVAERPGSYTVIAGQPFRSPGSITSEGDWSNAAFWLSAGALGEEITCEGLQHDSSQGDKIITTLLKRFGADVRTDSNSASAKANELRPLVIDAADIPDLVPVLAVLAAACQGTTTIGHAARLRLKESDRLSAMAENLVRLGGVVEELPDGLAIHGRGHLHGATVKSYGDHRIVMAMVIASLLCKEDIIIEGAEAVEKSYPRFFKDLKLLGGQVDIL